MWLDIVFYILAGISIVACLLLSSSGSTNNLVTSSASELEIFKKTKDRGFIKIVQLILFLLTLILLTIGLIIRFVS